MEVTSTNLGRTGIAYYFPTASMMNFGPCLIQIIEKQSVACPSYLWVLSYGRSSSHGVDKVS